MPGCQALGATKFARHGSSRGVSAKILAQHAKKLRFSPVLGLQGELFRAHTHARPSRAKNFAHRTHKHGDIETNDTTARPQDGAVETDDASAPEKCTKEPISHSQRRWRFQSHTGTSEQRRSRFQTTGPPGLQGLAAASVGGGGAWPGFEPTRRANGSRRGRLAGGPPPTGTPSSPAPQNSTCGARNTRGATSAARTKPQHTARGPKRLSASGPSHARASVAHRLS